MLTAANNRRQTGNARLHQRQSHLRNERPKARQETRKGRAPGSHLRKKEKPQLKNETGTLPNHIRKYFSARRITSLFTSSIFSYFHFSVIRLLSLFNIILYSRYLHIFIFHIFIHEMWSNAATYEVYLSCTFASIRRCSAFQTVVYLIFKFFVCFSPVFRVFFTVATDSACRSHAKRLVQILDLTRSPPC